MINLSLAEERLLRRGPRVEVCGDVATVAVHNTFHRVDLVTMRCSCMVGFSKGVCRYIGAALAERARRRGYQVELCASYAAAVAYCAEQRYVGRVARVWDRAGLWWVEYGEAAK